MGFTKKSEALAEARRVFKGHGLRGARIRVWENLGWHLSLEHRHYGIWYRDAVKGPRYWGLCSFNGRGTGDIRFNHGKFCGRTPKEVVEKMIAAARAELRKDQRLVEELGASYRGPRREILLGGRPSRRFDGRYGKPA